MTAHEIREYRPGPDTRGLRACIVELQDYERVLEPALRAGAEMADAYLAYMFARCAEWGGRILVAVDGDEVIGFVCVWTRVPPAGPDDLPFERAYVSDLAVRAGHRRRGIGRALLDRAQAAAGADGAVLLQVGVRARNHAARRLYAAAGFDEDRIELSKPIGRSSPG